MVFFLVSPLKEDKKDCNDCGTQNRHSRFQCAFRLPCSRASVDLFWLASSATYSSSSSLRLSGEDHHEIRIGFDRGILGSIVSVKNSESPNLSKGRCCTSRVISSHLPSPPADLPGFYIRLPLLSPNTLSAHTLVIIGAN
jgi:hypothetical protein